MLYSMNNDSRRNKYDTKDSLELGDKAELVFRRLAEKRGWELTEASFDCNVNEHWDFLMQRGSDNFKIDVKAMKRLNRGDLDVQDRWIWIELHGVRSQDQGWLYHGKADLISFEKMTSFVIVKRTDLIELVERLVDNKTLVHSSREAKYRVYNRPGRPDRITLIETDTLNPIKWDEWDKRLYPKESKNGT
ncbi:hypothetical protein ASJ33_01520 [Dehalococcoides mccartyi]|nr:hypothetical protein ASJ33_01520 [Dehalococcoides mccartyi]